jgi:hypothetical protein
MNMTSQCRTRYRALPGLLLLLVLPAAAQIQAGDNLNLNLNGLMSAGYSGTYGNQINSSHGLNWGGNGTLSGSYYDPNFLSFALSPYYNQARQSSEFRSLFDTGGFDFNSNIFAGSRFPGSVGYQRSWDSEGNFGIPGLPDFTTRSNGQGFSIGWSALVPDWPTLTATFSDGSSDYTVPGTDLHGSNNFKNLALRSGYTIKGFSLNAGYNTGTSESNIPLVFGSQTEQKVSSDNDSFTFSASHMLPMHGSFGSSFSRSNINADYLGSQYNGTVDTVNANAGVSPTPKLNFSVGMGYTDSLTGSLFQNLVSGSGQAATGASIFQSQMSSNALYLTGVANYVVGRLQLQGNVQRRQQTYLGSSFSANTYGGNVAYTTPALGGFLSASFNVADTTSDYSSGNSLGFASNVSFSRNIQAWAVSGDFSYAQNVQSYLITYTNSYYVYSGNVRRRFFNGGLVWSGSAAGSHTAFTSQPHTGNSSESYSTSLGIRHLTGAASYAKSDGFGLLAGAGLTLPPGVPPGTIPPEWIILYGGHSYAFSLSGSPVRKLSLGATFSKARSNTSTGGLGSFNDSEHINAILNYQLRKLTFTAGYGRLIQGFSASGLPASNLNSFFAGFSRSFNFF